MFGLQSIVPPSKDIAEIAGVVEFIQYVATSKGLKDALDELEQKQKDIEQMASIFDAQKKDNDKLSKSLADQQTDVIFRLQNVEHKETEADAMLEDAQNKRADAQVLSDALKADRSAFETDMAARLKEYNDKNIEITAREENARQAQSVADAMKADLDFRMAELKKITG